MRHAFFILILLGLALGTGVASAQLHSSQLPPLGVDTVFPRCTGRELEVAGYPDHLHAQSWYGWEVLTGPDGVTYGPGSLCDRKTLLPREGLIVDPDQKQIGHFSLRHNPGYSDCDMIQFLELLDWADHVVPELLGLAAVDTLTVLNPDNVSQYQELTGQGVWRFYALEGNRAIMQPWPVLQNRTLDGHAAFALVTDWILQQNLGDALPPWLHQGLVEYMSEDGTHLLNYMGEFRTEGANVLMSAPLVDALLASGINPDEGTDRENFRRASYSAFLMVWQLIENEGGLTALQDFLALVADGVDVDEATLQVYGMGLNDLTVFLDPVVNGEPVGSGTQRRTPHVQP
jgi:hypothetical protein